MRHMYVQHSAAATWIHVQPTARAVTSQLVCDVDVVERKYGCCTFYYQIVATSHVAMYKGLSCDSTIA